MGTEKILDHVKINLDAVGFWIWFFLFGLLDMALSIIYRPEYLSLGLYVFGLGITGYFISILLDKISKYTWIKKPPLCYFFITFIIKMSLFIALCIIIFKKYPEFKIK